MVTAHRSWVVPEHRLPFYLKVFRLTSANCRDRQHPACNLLYTAILRNFLVHKSTKASCFDLTCCGVQKLNFLYHHSVWFVQSDRMSGWLHLFVLLFDWQFFMAVSPFVNKLCIVFPWVISHIAKEKIMHARLVFDWLLLENNFGIRYFPVSNCFIAKWDTLCCFLSILDFWLLAHSFSPLPLPSPPYPSPPLQSHRRCYLIWNTTLLWKWKWANIFMTDLLARVNTQWF